MFCTGILVQFRSEVNTNKLAKMLCNSAYAKTKYRYRYPWYGTDAGTDDFWLIDK